MSVPAEDRQAYEALALIYKDIQFDPPDLKRDKLFIVGGELLTEEEFLRRYSK